MLTQWAQVHLSRYFNGDVLMNLKVIEGLLRFPVSKTRYHLDPFGIIRASREVLMS